MHLFTLVYSLFFSLAGLLSVNGASSSITMRAKTRLVIFILYFRQAVHGVRHISSTECHLLRGRVARDPRFLWVLACFILAFSDCTFLTMGADFLEAGFQVNSRLHLREVVSLVPTARCYASLAT